MSESEIKRFVGDMKNNPELQAEGTAMAPSVDSLLALAKQHGYDFDAEDVERYVKSQMPAGELTEEQMAQVTGGATSTAWIAATNQSLVWLIAT